MKAWSGRVALVTGASAGIGKSVAERLLSEGMRVATCARRIDRLRHLAPAEAQDRYLPIECDLRDEAQILQMFQTVRTQWGGVDVMINNAGLGHKASLSQGKTEHFREMLDVNVLALSICTREAVTDMRARGDDGMIIHISSMAAHRVPPGSGFYAATKHAVRALSEGLRMELREMESKIRVSSISPGYVETEFAELYHQSAEAAKETYGRFKVLEAADIAETVAYLLSCPPHMHVSDVLMRPTEQAN